jgi:FkbM family methyltransferase
MRPAIDRAREYLGCARALGVGRRAQWAILWKETKNLRVRLGLAAHHPEAVYALPTGYGPLHFRDNFGDITNLAPIFYRQVYRVRALAPPGVILDVGANIGLAAAWLAHHNPGRTIYCFEPLAASAALIALNCPGAKVEQVAVGATRGRVRLSVDRDGVMASRIPCRWETREEEFPVISLDEFAAARGVDQVALIKIDAEGMEAEILEGSRATLARTHQVVMETHSRALHDQALARLGRAGFRIDGERFGGATGLVFASRPDPGAGSGG